MEKQPIELAVLFADITGSTRLYEKLGTARAMECVARCLKLMQGSAVGCGGRVVQTIGDEVLCVFPTASAAAQAAAEMQLRVALEEPAFGQRLQIHVGLQFGPVLEQGEGVFGDCVNVAARMVKLAKPSQIIAAKDCVEALTQPWKAQTRAIGKLPVKGRHEEIDVYEVLWQPSEEMTYMTDGNSFSWQKRQAQLRLAHSGKEIVLGSGRVFIKLGRDSSSDVVISDRKASRDHARIERRLDKFVLVDVSSNGTFVTFDGGLEVALKHEEVVLHGHGSISFGHSYGADPTEVAVFHVEPPA